MKLLKTAEEFTKTKYILNYYKDAEGTHVYILENENETITFMPYGLELIDGELGVPYGTADYNIGCYMHNYFNISSDDLHYALTEEEFLVNVVVEAI